MSWPSTDYDPAPARELPRSVTVLDIIDFFSKNMVNDNLGTICNAQGERGGGCGGEVHKLQFEWIRNRREGGSISGCGCRSEEEKENEVVDVEEKFTNASLSGFVIKDKGDLSEVVVVYYEVSPKKDVPVKYHKEDNLPTTPKVGEKKDVDASTHMHASDDRHVIYERKASAWYQVTYHPDHLDRLKMMMNPEEDASHKFILIFSWIPADIWLG